ncbi:MAG: glycoside hydrolase [Leeuwenhoekiella sp.]
MRRHLIPLLLLTFLNACAGQGQEEGDRIVKQKTSKKIYGVSFVASRDSVSPSHIEPLLDVGFDQAALMPFGFLRSPDEPELFFNTDRQWVGERVSGTKQYAKQLKAARIEVMIKPQIWIRRGEFTGDLLMADEAKWQVFEKGYREFILLYAKVAEEVDAEIFCIGTELFNFVNARTAFWDELIKEVRTVYSGKITYAENWDKVARNPLWENLDYIGVDAYFPVSEAQTPTVAEARAGWKEHKKALQALSRKLDKPVLFTEYGYRSLDFAGKEPWVADRTEGGVNHTAQQNLTEALFDEFYSEPWFAGGFIWKWFVRHERAGGMEDNRFTPQNKPLQQFLKNRFKG